MIDTKDSNIVGIKHMAFAVENIETVSEKMAEVDRLKKIPDKKKK